MSLPEDSVNAFSFVSANDSFLAPGLEKEDRPQTQLFPRGVHRRIHLGSAYTFSLAHKLG